MFLCSAVPGNECQLIDTPINDFKTYHECAYYGYDYSSILLREFSTDFVDNNRVFTAFSCKEDASI
jgi:hypothetical protein|tara:strand:- start:4 stop:201 length:198 start_codon:yes stop_codon:yes gene_type:complete